MWRSRLWTKFWVTCYFLLQTFEEYAVFMDQILSKSLFLTLFFIQVSVHNNHYLYHIKLESISRQNHKHIFKVLLLSWVQTMTYIRINWLHTAIAAHALCKISFLICVSCILIANHGKSTPRCLLETNLCRFYCTL